jgi:hypothetical protein
LAELAPALARFGRRIEPLAAAALGARGSAFRGLLGRRGYRGRGGQLDAARDFLGPDRVLRQQPDRDLEARVSRRFLSLRGKPYRRE